MHGRARTSGRWRGDGDCGERVLASRRACRLRGQTAETAPRIHLQQNTGNALGQRKASTFGSAMTGGECALCGKPLRAGRGYDLIHPRPSHDVVCEVCAMLELGPETRVSLSIKEDPGQEDPLLMILSALERAHLVAARAWRRASGRESQGEATPEEAISDCIVRVREVQGQLGREADPRVRIAIVGDAVSAMGESLAAIAGALGGGGAARDASEVVPESADLIPLLDREGEAKLRRAGAWNPDAWRASRSLFERGVPAILACLRDDLATIPAAEAWAGFERSKRELLALG